MLVFNQYYSPGVEATAQLLGDLCRALAADMEVTVVTGRLREVAPKADVTRDGAVRVIRVNSAIYDRGNLGARALNYVTYLMRAFSAGMRVRRPDVVLCMTDPPVIANVGLLVARRFRAPLVVISQDVFPEVAVELQRLENPVVISVLRYAIGHYLRRADRVVAIGETMRRRLEEKGARPESLRVIPNWVDTSMLSPQPRDNLWAKHADLSGRFVVMHSGNVGHAQDLETLVRASTLLRDLGDLMVVVIGTGARLERLVALSERLAADQVRFLNYQPREVLPESLSAADIHVVGLASGLAGYVVPSRLYGILSVGRPVIVAADAESETARLVEEVGCGVVVSPGRPDLLAAAIRRAYDGEFDLEAMGSRGREYVLREADRDVALARYRELIIDLA